MKLQHEFVGFIPEKISPGILYVSIEYRIAMHLCACGCREEIVTPITPADWELNFDGASVSLYPSIGNWNYPCQSHYWITKNKVIWAGKWSSKKIKENKKRDVDDIKKFFEKNEKKKKAKEKRINRDN